MDRKKTSTRVRADEFSVEEDRNGGFTLVVTEYGNDKIKKAKVRMDDYMISHLMEEIWKVADRRKRAVASLENAILRRNQ